MEAETLKLIVQALKVLRTEERLKVSDELLFDCSVRIFNSHKPKPLAYFKDEYSEPLENERNEEPATEKQLNLLTKLNLKYDKNISKFEAKKLLETKLGKGTK